MSAPSIKQVSTGYWNTLSPEEKMNKIKDGQSPLTQPQQSPQNSSHETADTTIWNTLSTDEKLEKIKSGTEPKPNYVPLGYSSNVLWNTHSTDEKLNLIKSGNWPFNITPQQSFEEESRRRLRLGLQPQNSQFNETLWDTLTAEEKLDKIKSGAYKSHIPYYSSSQYAKYSSLQPSHYQPSASTSYEMEKIQLKRIDEIKNERAEQLKNIDEIKYEIEELKVNKCKNEEEFEDKISDAKINKDLQLQNASNLINQTKSEKELNSARLNANMNAYVSSPYRTSNYYYDPYNFSYIKEREKKQLSHIDNIQKQRLENSNKIVELEQQKNNIEIDNDSKINELELNKSLTLKESDVKLTELEENLELANINKRKNSRVLETAISSHQRSSYQYPFHSPYYSQNYELNESVAKSRTDDIKKKLDLEQSFKSPLKSVTFPNEETNTISNN